MNEQDIIESFNDKLEENLLKTRYVSFPTGMTDPNQRMLYFKEQAFRRSAQEALLETVREMRE